MKLGYKPIAYEATTFSNSGDQLDRINDRETQESQNLVDRVLKENPKARVFIYCGYSHATETWRKSNAKEFAWMAARLKRLTGIDPLTIDQTEQYARVDPNLDPLHLKAAEAINPLKGPTVFRAKDGKYGVFGNYAGMMDMQVFHPRVALKNGRPAWLAINGYRKPYKVDTSQITTRTLVQAFVASEPNTAIPMDQLIVTPSQPASLMLPKGEYRIVLQAEDGTSKPLTQIRIK